jgi:hypothetical protein
MRALSFLILIGLASATSSHAGGDGSAAPRKQFRQSSTYPFVFRPECYLANAGPVPLRFAAAQPECHQRKAPALTPAAKGIVKEETPTPADKPAAPVDPSPLLPTAPEPAFPAPMDAQPPKTNAHDFSKVPDEVLEYFKNTEGRPLRRDYLFDPIFQPALPNDLPKSKATYQQK